MGHGNFACELQYLTSAMHSKASPYRGPKLTLTLKLMTQNQCDPKSIGFLLSLSTNYVQSLKVIEQEL